MSDDHTGQAWGIYEGVLKGYVQNKNIKRLASEGVALENCLVSNSICTPSRATILTRQYSHVNGLKTLGNGLSPGCKNIAKELKKAPTLKSNSPIFNLQFLLFTVQDINCSTILSGFFLNKSNS